MQIFSFIGLFVVVLVAIAFAWLCLFLLIAGIEDTATASAITTIIVFIITAFTITSLYLSATDAKNATSKPPVVVVERGGH